MTLPSRALLRTWAVPIAIVVIGTLPWAYTYLLAPEPDYWMVDLNVYREAGVSILEGRRVYEHVTPAPQSLPFTYPPFAALLAVPLALVPFGVLGSIWFYGQLFAIVATVRLAAAPLLARFDRHRGVVSGLLSLALAYTLPVEDGLRFGQVNAFLVLAVLIDVARRDLLRRVRLPQGVLVGLATAIKLTPGVFIVYYLLTRQWRAAATSIGTVAVTILGVLAVAPRLSLAFWTDALLAPDRLGHNDGTANQSVRALLLRIGPEGSAGTALWLLLVAIIAVVGYVAARWAYDHGELLLAFTLVAAIGVLVSPVSWSHHFHWLLPGVCWLVASSRRWQVISGVALWLVLTLHVTWMAHWQLMGHENAVYDRHRVTGHPLWNIPHNIFVLVGLGTLLGLAHLARTPPRVGTNHRSTSAGSSAGSSTSTSRGA